MKTKRIMLASVMLLLSNMMKAQFSSSERVYCYEYLYTIEDGIKSTPKSGDLYFVNFQNNFMGICWGNKKNAADNLSKDSEYYANQARNDLAKKYREWKSGPSEFGIIFAVLNMIAFNSSYSSSNRYTYREQIAHPEITGYMLSLPQYSGRWGTPEWRSTCYSFSSDRSEMIYWSTSNSVREYYRLIDANSLKPNTDFLW